MTPPDEARPARLGRPGWPEVVAAAATYGLLVVVVPPAIAALTEGAPAMQGHALAALSGLLGLAAFLAAVAIRRRSLSAFHVQRTTARWLLLGLLLGIAAVIVTRVILIAITVLGGSALTDPQASYQSAADDGVGGFALQLLLLGVLTGVGEELAFRGVLTSALTRWGAPLAIVVSTGVFAVVHGINLALIPAVVVGALAAILMIRSRSVWPGVVLHVTHNALGLAISQLL